MFLTYWKYKPIRLIIILLTLTSTLCIKYLLLHKKIPFQCTAPMSTPTNINTIVSVGNSGKAHWDGL